SRYGYVEREAMAEGLRSVWRELSEAGVRVVPIRDTPWMPFQPGDCLASGKPEDCEAPRSEVEASDIFAHAASTLDRVDVVDMTDGICGPQTCETVVGNMIVWRDKHHLTATYTTALAPYLARKAGLPVPGLAEPVIAAGKNKDNTHTISAHLTCGALGQGKPMERDVKLRFENGEIVYRHGDWQARKERYEDRKSTRLNSSHVTNSYAFICLKKKSIHVTIN